MLMQTFKFDLVRISYGLPIMAVCLDRMTHTKVIGKKSLWKDVWESWDNSLMTPCAGDIENSDQEDLSMMIL